MDKKKLIIKKYLCINYDIKSISTPYSNSLEVDLSINLKIAEFLYLFFFQIYLNCESPLFYNIFYT